VRSYGLVSSLLFAFAFALASPVRAEPAATLRLATVAPDGTSWARELRAWARDVEGATQGALHIKLYFGGIAGNEEVTLARIRREQLDGAIGSEMCTVLSPSLKIGRIVGVFQTRAENAYVLSRLKPIVDAELLKSGFINFGEAGLGPEVLFTREPVKDLATLRRLRWWIWDSDFELPPQARALGLKVVQTPLETAGRAFEEGKFDGFITIPTAALAFQWTTQVKYLTPLRVSFRSGCLIVATRAFDPLPLEVQRALKGAAGKLSQRIEELGRHEDDALLGGLLSKQGVAPVAESDQLRSEFYGAARAVRPGSRIVADEMLSKVMGWLADYRAEHGL
jgi:TRAP-type C4-dicarboxylate transport system substrate-binding protein